MISGNGPRSSFISAHLPMVKLANNSEASISRSGTLASKSRAGRGVLSDFSREKLRLFKHIAIEGDVMGTFMGI